VSARPPHIEEFADRADALAAIVRGAGTAPLLLTVDDSQGCPLVMALPALHWTGETGLVRDEDRLHGAWFAAEAFGAVLERSGDDGPAYRSVGPKVEFPQKVPLEGVEVIDEAFLRGFEFRERWSAVAHFLAVTQGRGALLALISSRAPVVGHIRRWLLALLQTPLPEGADVLHAAWFAVTGAGFLFPPSAFASDATPRGWTYLELGARTDD
jgi:hypothetical protein